MYLLGSIKLFEQKGLLITLVNMLIAQFGEKNSQSNLCTELVLWSKDKSSTMEIISSAWPLL